MAENRDRDMSKLVIKRDLTLVGIEQSKYPQFCEVGFDPQLLQTDFNPGIWWRNKASRIVSKNHCHDGYNDRFHPRQFLEK